MQISKLSWMALLAGAAALQLQAQSASPELQDKALELLRQTMSQGAPSTTVAAPQPQPAPVPAAAMEPAMPSPAVSPAMTAPASSDQQEQAIMLLRQHMADSATAPASAPAKQKTAKAKPSKEAHKSSTSTTSSMPPAADAAVTQPSGQSATPALPELSSGPKTKQQRLMDLLEQYKADKLTPAEYHAERAKIIAEP
jgi:hypothetical protein